MCAKALGQLRQLLNMSKVEGRPVGEATAHLHTAAHDQTRPAPWQGDSRPRGAAGGARGQQPATALNLRFTGGAGDCGGGVSREMSYIPLSVFGRASAMAVFGLHRVTFRMEHSGMPQGATVAAIMVE